MTELAARLAAMTPGGGAWTVVAADPDRAAVLAQAVARAGVECWILPIEGATTVVAVARRLEAGRAAGVLLAAPPLVGPERYAADVATAAAQRLDLPTVFLDPV
ncbi:MAG: hypothetical protein AAF192_15910 [Pseudomonadota bacterium]